MHKVTLSKTLLTALSKYERFLAAIDTAIQTIAETSYQHYASTQKTIEDIIDNIDKKTTLHNLRIKTEKLLSETPHKYARVLILTYVHRLTSKKVAQMIKKTERTVFRYLHCGLQWFTEHLDNIASAYEFTQILYEEFWLRNIYNRLKQEKT